MQRRLLSENQEYKSELNESDLTGYIGEILVQQEIALKYHMRVVKIPDEMNLDTDFITATGKRLEVMTRRIELKIDKRKGRREQLWWPFKELKYESGKLGPRRTARQSDFYIFVCMPKTGYKPRGFYVVPADALVNKKDRKKPTTSFAPTINDFHREKCERSRWFSYKNKWELIEPEMFEKLKVKDTAELTLEE